MCVTGRAMRRCARASMRTRLSFRQAWQASGNSTRDRAIDENNNKNASEESRTKKTDNSVERVVRNQQVCSRQLVVDRSPTVFAPATGDQNYSGDQREPEALHAGLRRCGASSGCSRQNLFILAVGLRHSRSKQVALTFPLRRQDVER